jgi:hypothetical protein
MKQSIQFESQKSQMFPILLGIISIFVGIFFTYDQVILSLENDTKIEAAIAEKNQSGELLKTLNKYEEKSKEQSTQGTIVGVFREDTILEKVFELVGTRGNIWNITITPGERLSTGLALATISLNIETDSLDNFLAILDDATKWKGQRYYIRGLTIPYESGKSEAVNTVLQLGMYHTGR